MPKRLTRKDSVAITLRLHVDELRLLDAAIGEGDSRSGYIRRLILDAVGDTHEHVDETIRLDGSRVGKALDILRRNRG